MIWGASKQSRKTDVVFSFGTHEGKAAARAGLTWNITDGVSLATETGDENLVLREISKTWCGNQCE
jgi:phosphoribosyl-dephospho-CoA transferase